MKISVVYEYRIYLNKEELLVYVEEGSFKIIIQNFNTTERKVMEKHLRRNRILRDVYNAGFKKIYIYTKYFIFRFL